MKILFVVSVLFLTGCATTGQSMAQMQEGMTRAEVEALLGKPDGFRKSGDLETVTYINRLVSGWAWDRGDYIVTFKDGKVVEWGAAQVRAKEGPARAVTVLTLP